MEENKACRGHAEPSHFTLLSEQVLIVGISQIVSYSFTITANGSSMKRCYLIFIEWFKAAWWEKAAWHGEKPGCHVTQTQGWGPPMTWEDFTGSRECVGVLQPLNFRRPGSMAPPYRKVTKQEFLSREEHSGDTWVGTMVSKVWSSWKIKYMQKMWAIWQGSALLCQEL